LKPQKPNTLYNVPIRFLCAYRGLKPEICEQQ